MSEIRSQATPRTDDAKNELATAVLELLNRAAQVGTPGRAITAHVVARGLSADGWSKRRTVGSAAELKALPNFSLIRGLEREGQRSGDVYEKTGPDHWLALDPGDRFDGEETTPSHAILRIYKAGIRILFTPGDA